MSISASSHPPGAGPLTGWRVAVVAIVAVAAAGSAIAIFLATAAGGLPAGPTPIPWIGVQALIATSFGSMGALIIIRAPHNVVGWILLAIAVLVSISSVALQYAVTSLLRPEFGLDGAGQSYWLSNFAGSMAIALAVGYLPLLFPTGRVPSPRWRPVLWLVIGITGLQVVQAFEPQMFMTDPPLDNPITIDLVGRFKDQIEAVATVLRIVVPILTLAAPIVRFQTGDAIERQQVKWFAYVVMLTAVGIITSSLLPESALADALWVGSLATLTLLPVAIAVAILRYRLFEIDRLVSRSLGYGLLTAILIGVYAVAIVVLQGPLGTFTGGDTLAVALSTLVVAALFQPVRARVQRAVDRRFDRARYDAERIAVSFAESLRDQLDLPTLAGMLDGAVERSMAPTSVGVWLRGERPVEH